MRNTRFKLEKLCKIKTERDALDLHKSETSGMRYGPAVDEAVSTSIHALAFDVDQSSMTQRLSVPERSSERP